jgi:hypothetical protein
MTEQSIVRRNVSKATRNVTFLGDADRVRSSPPLRFASDPSRRHRVQGTALASASMVRVSEWASADEQSPPSMRRSVGQDLAGSTWPQRILLLATAGWVAYEWGFGNETVTPWILVRVVSDTSGGWSVLATAAVGFTFTLVQQAISGLTAVYGFSMFGRTASTARRSLRARLDREPRTWDEQRLGTKALVVFALGTTAVVLIESTTTGSVGYARQRRVVAQAAVLVASIVAVIGAVGATAVLIGRSVPALESSTEWALRILGNPLFWIGLLVAVIVGRRLAAGSSINRR